MVKPVIGEWAPGGEVSQLDHVIQLTNSEHEHSINGWASTNQSITQPRPKRGNLFRPGHDLDYINVET